MQLKAIRHYKIPEGVCGAVLRAIKGDTPPPQTSGEISTKPVQGY
jgi:hypothetical protein